MDAKEFEERTGRPPENDDLERVNCAKAGEPGHHFCGWCGDHNRPMYECGCSLKRTEGATVWRLRKNCA